MTYFFDLYNLGTIYKRLAGGVFLFQFVFMQGGIGQPQLLCC